MVVTSRQGQPHTWSEMTNEQKLVLEPLCAGDAMVALWRQVRKIKTSTEDDDEAMNTIVKPESDNITDYRALMELFGDEVESSLGGLPLALVQAGTYIVRFECLFSEYLNLFRNPGRTEDMYDILRSTEDSKPIRESQRSIWTTWRISVERLSDKAYSILRAMAMLGPDGVEERIVKRIVKEVTGEKSNVDRMFRSLVMEDLIHGSSLICRDEGEREQGGEKYRMHRLVRRFVVSDVERGSTLWNEAYSAALVAVHEIVQTELKHDGYSFRTLPDVFGNCHRKIVNHTTALVQHHMLPTQRDEVQNVSEVEDLHLYIGKAIEFMGEIEEEVEVWKRLVDILHNRLAEHRRRSFIESLLDCWHGRNQGCDLKSRFVEVYGLLGNALEINVMRSKASSVWMRSLDLKYSGIDPGIFVFFADLLLCLLKKPSKRDIALEMHEQNLNMLLSIQRPNNLYLALTTSLDNLGDVYCLLGELQKALEEHEQILDMLLAIPAHDKPHLAITTSLGNFWIAYQVPGNWTKRWRIWKRN